MKIPMTAREQLVLAREMGHELSVSTRERPDFPDAPPKHWVHCTCGWKSQARRSRSAVNSALAWHLGRVIAEALDAPRRVNGA